MEIKYSSDVKKESTPPPISPFEHWRRTRQKNSMGFAMIPNEIELYLPRFQTKALNLYLFYFLKAKNETGGSFYSVNSAHNLLNISERSINYWNQELESLGLIARINRSQNGNKNRTSKMTYILPLSNFYYFENMSIEEFIKLEKEKKNSDQEKIRGKLSQIIHLFQPIAGSPTNIICLVYERSCKSKNNGGELETFNTIKTYIFFKNHNYVNYDLKIDTSDISDDRVVYSLKTDVLDSFKELNAKITSSIIVISKGANILMEYNKEILEMLDSISVLENPISEIENYSNVEEI